MNIIDSVHSIKARRIHASSEPAIHMYGGTLDVEAREISAGSDPAIYYSVTSTFLSVRHARIISGSAAAIHFAAGGGTSSRLKMLGCLLDGVGYSITAASAVSVECLGGCCATLLPQNNVTPVGILTRDDFT